MTHLRALHVLAWNLLDDPDAKLDVPLRTLALADLGVFLLPALLQEVLGALLLFDGWLLLLDLFEL